MRFISLILLLFSFQSHAQESVRTSFWKTFGNEWVSPIYSKETRPALYTGAAITGLIVLARENTFDPIQEKMAEDRPMGDLATFGDYMGQLIPNLLYIGGMYWHYKSTGQHKSYQRAVLMFKTTLYSGLTTNVLKRVANERRPSGGDRLSFPSGHTTTAFAFAAVVGLEHSKPWAISAYTLATIVGLSRMNDNAHYLHDVTFGATIGISYAISLYHLQQKKSQNDQSSWLILPDQQGLKASFVTNF